MSNTIFISSYNQVHVQLTSNDGIEYEIYEAFNFLVPGHKFVPAFKSGFWDGRIYLYNKRTKLIYKGLLPRIYKWAEERGYKVEADDSLIDTVETKSFDHYQEFIDSLDLPFIPRDYQMQSFIHAVENNRLTILSPTGSGKSLIIYMIFKYLNIKTLIIVPTTNLVHQMSGDFKSYGYKEEPHLIYSGQDKDFDGQLGITTWQSVFRLGRDWFDQFELVIVDETHQAKAKSLTTILEKLTSTKYRFGTTGTLDGSKINRLVIEGLLGPVHQVTTTSELIEEEILARFEIQALVLKYPEELSMENKGKSYFEEVDLIIQNQARNEIIYRLVNSIPGNNLVIFNYVEKHGKVLEALFREKSDRPIYYIDGTVDAKVRNAMRSQIEKETNCIVIAGAKAFATGTNIVMLNNIFFTSPSKSRIQTLQAIGRVLRKSSKKLTAQLFDIADDLSFLNNRKTKKYNYTMLHFFERIKIYKSENFPYTIRNLKLPKD